MPTDGAESARSGVGAEDSEEMSRAGPDDRSVARAQGSSETAESENAAPVPEARSWVVPPGSMPSRLPLPSPLPPSGRRVHSSTPALSGT